MSLLEEISVPLPHKAYQIKIGKQLLSNPETFAKWATDREVLVVTNPTIAGFHLETLLAGLKPLAKKLEVYQAIDSEEAKSNKYLNEIYDQLLENNFSRRCLIVAFGGGVIGDLAGYAAATYQRGVDFIQIPTTVLSMVDSSVGGKVAINHPLGKNMIGAFWQPKEVIIDLDVLSTLAPQEISAGMAEVVKYGLISNYPFFQWLETNATTAVVFDYAAHLETFTYLISTSIKEKIKYVISDETEQGDRALLNLGHTFGHAIESILGYGKILHGQAVAIGMNLALQYSLALNKTHPEFNQAVGKDFQEPSAEPLTETDLQRYLALIARYKLPSTIPDVISKTQMLSYMQRDKKNLAEQIVLVLLQRAGQAYVNKQIKVAELEAFLAQHTVN